MLTEVTRITTTEWKKKEKKKNTDKKMEIDKCHAANLSTAPSTGTKMSTNKAKLAGVLHDQSRKKITSSHMNDRAVRIQ